MRAPDEAGRATDLAAWQTIGLAFRTAVESGRLDLPLPGSGRTRERWAAFADLAARRGPCGRGGDPGRTGGAADYLRGGDDVHAAPADRPGLARLAGHAEPDFLAEVYIRGDGEPVSVAQAEGLV